MLARDDAEYRIFHDLWKFSTDTATWETLTPSSGATPESRYCHAMAVVGTDIFIHGGTQDLTWLDDFWKYSTNSGTWEKLTKPKKGGGVAPTGRGCHVMTVVGGDLWMHGGLVTERVMSDELWRYSTTKATWEQLMTPQQRAKPSALILHGIAAVGNSFFIHGGQRMTKSFSWATNGYGGGQS